MKSNDAHARRVEQEKDSIKAEVEAEFADKIHQESLERVVEARGKKRKQPVIPDYRPEKRQKISSTLWVRLESKAPGRSNWAAPDALDSGNYHCA